VLSFHGLNWNTIEERRALSGCECKPDRCSHQEIESVVGIFKMGLQRKSAASADQGIAREFD
jgi:hypothetical protein